ncbi:FKBP-type peptidyl-prolyl cis-trans isomerase [Neolewinella litorea]|uniref:Peptidyl-prolyl cis-trans isomerase n=1 Tax=Neolewinella litorea TaxID=2562452 RepID=A0A4V3XL95_9BACT|nr:FKBP-type peptidyl-prolyl cis-trans isomerase [Neolewinella litorea]THH39993.1 peptidylprolyl isomerase [Neolewinella litorea]
MKTNHILVALTLILLTALGCNSEDCLSSDASIEEYLSDSIPAVELFLDNSPTGLYYIIQEEGDTVQPTLSNSVTVFYSGMTTNGDIFDQTGSSPRTFVLDNLIRGWELGIPLIGQGGRIRLFVPSRLAYGASQAGDICPNSDLIFDIELVSVQ